MISSGWWYTYPSEKWWSSSVGMILPNIWKVIKNHILTMYFNILTIYLWLTKIKFMFQTTNQSWYTWPPAGASHSNPLSSLGHQSSVGGSCIYLSINLFLGKKISICIYIYICINCHIRLILYIYIHIMDALFIWDMYHQFAFFMGGIDIHKPRILTDGWWHL